MTYFRTVAPAVCALLFIATSTITTAYGQQSCQPSLSVKLPRLSDTMINMKRYWSATLEVNAVTCLETSGSFELRVLRSKENATDLTFNEPVAWNSRQTDVVIELWADEAVLSYQIGKIRPCTCRTDFGGQ